MGTCFGLAKDERDEMQAMIDREGGNFNWKHGIGGIMPRKIAKKNMILMMKR
jgi:hypothetical protein